MENKHGDPPFPPYCRRCGYLSAVRKGLLAAGDGEKIKAKMAEKTAGSPDEELSFKVFVREEKHDDEELLLMIKEESQNGKSKGKMMERIKNNNNNNNNLKPSLLSRNESRTESGRFLLKVFLPVSISSKVPKSSSMRVPSKNSSSIFNVNNGETPTRTKSSHNINSRARICMKSPPRKSWLDDNISSMNFPPRSKNTSDSSIRTNGSRFAERNSSSAMWFPNTRKYKPPTQTGCLFF